jgi:uncharacterized protein
MGDMLAAAVANLTTPMVLFFVLGALAAAFRSDLAVPEPISKAMALYLMMAIGFKGGTALAVGGLTLAALWTLAAAMALSFAIPLVAYAFLKATTRLGRADAAAVAAHYGSISVVTFIAASEFLAARGLAYDGYMVAVVAAMETPAIVTGLWLARRGVVEAPAGPAGARAPRPSRPGLSRQLAREIFLNGSVVLLVGAMVVGAVAGKKGAETVAPFFDAPFRGILCLFLLDLGLVAVRRLREAKGMSPALLVFGLYMPPVGAAIGLAVAALIGLSAGNAAVLAVLCASASYIAVPAALRIALPEANPAITVTLSLAITFPFNVALGIPLYAAAARALWGG